MAILCVDCFALLYILIHFELSHAFNDQVIGGDSQTVDQTAFMTLSVTIGRGDYLNCFQFGKNAF